MAYDPVVLGEWLRTNMACQLLYQTHFFVIDFQLPSGNIVLAIRVFPQETAKLLESTRGYDQNESLSNIRLYSVTINNNQFIIVIMSITTYQSPDLSHIAIFICSIRPH